MSASLLWNFMAVSKLEFYFCVNILVILIEATRELLPKVVAKNLFKFMNLS